MADFHAKRVYSPLSPPYRVYVSGTLIPMTQTTDPYATARDAHTRVATLLQMQEEARSARDAAVLALLRDGHRVNQIAREIRCIEGTVRQIKRKAGL